MNPPFKLTSNPRDVTKSFSPLRLLFEPARSAANGVFELTNAPVRLEMVRGERGDAEDEEGESSDARTTGRVWTAHSVVSERDVSRYVDAVLASEKTESSMLPGVAKRQIYALVVRVVLHLAHTYLDGFEGKRLFGRVVSLSQTRSNMSDLERCALDVDPQLLNTIADATASRRPLVNGVLDALIYKSTVRFALRLLADVVSSTQITMFGVRISCTASLSDGPLALAVRNYDADWDDRKVRETFSPIVASLLADDDVNVALIPDHLEEEFYYAIIGMLLNIAGAGVDDLRVDSFGVRADVRLS